MPDTYQGEELWDLSLVDPDNRRPVDFDLRQRLLGELNSLSVEQVWQRREEGLPKLWLTCKALQFRRRHPELFGAGSTYEPLQAQGSKTVHALAFARAGAVVTIVPRLVIGLKNDWAETTLRLPDGTWHNELTSEDIAGGERPMAESCSAGHPSRCSPGRLRVEG